MEANTSSGMERRMSPYLLAIIMITVVLSISSIYLGLNAYRESDFQSGALFLALGVSTFTVTMYLLFQTRRRMLKMSVEFPKMNTSLECTKCGNKSVREFQRGDFVFRKVEDACAKCNEKALKISAIFREVKDKEKAKEATYSL